MAIRIVAGGRPRAPSVQLRAVVGRLDPAVLVGAGVAELAMLGCLAQVYRVTYRVMGGRLRWPA